ncbi:MAG: hypothetical protein ACRDLP_06045 [Solirubrobacteraceae bacterium]
MNATATIAGGPQHLRALQRANEVRLARAELKRRVMDGDVSAAEVILSSPWEVESMAVSELLMSQHRWGHTRARRFLATIPMTETKTIGSLTERQRQSLADLLAAQAPTARAGAPPARSALTVLV